MTSAFHVIIPARYHSSRFPGKLLMDLGGMSVLERVYRQALKACPERVIIATDHEAIEAAAMAFGAEVVMTDPTHASGTDRVAEVIQKQALPAEAVVVNVQGDEPLIAPELIRQVAALVHEGSAPMATLCWPIQDEAMAVNPNVVKVVRDCKNHALYFSRSPIPARRSDKELVLPLLRHVGLYAYRASFLLDVVQWPVCGLETTEALEQLRVLWTGHPIRVEQACVEPLQDINTPEDLAKACAQLNSDPTY